MWIWLQHLAVLINLLSYVPSISSFQPQPVVATVQHHASSTTTRLYKTPPLDSSISSIDSSDSITDINLDEEEDMERKMAWSKHTILSIAASIMCVPPEIFTTPPMFDPRPPKTPSEIDHRQTVRKLLSKSWDPTAGFQISKDEVDLVEEMMDSGGTGHNPSTYGEVTQLGARQLFHYMNMHDNDGDDGNAREDGIHFIDLGSGNGKLAIQSFLEVPNMRTIRGVELAPARHAIAKDAWEGMQLEAESVRVQLLENYHECGDDVGAGATTTLDLIEGDMFQTDISSATHIYIASLCFTDGMMDKLGEKILKEGHMLKSVATLKPIPIKDFDERFGCETEVRYVEMSWTKPRGMGATVYFYLRS